MANPVLSAAISGTRKVLLTWTYGANADFKIFWKSNKPTGQEYVLLATTNEFSYLTADLDPSKIYSFYIGANVGIYFFYSNVVELFVSCGKGVVLTADPPTPPERQWFDHTQATLEVYNHNYGIQTYASDPHMYPVAFNSDSISSQLTTSFTHSISDWFVDGYSPVRRGMYSTFIYYRFILDFLRNTTFQSALISQVVQAEGAYALDWDWEFTGADIDDAPVPAGNVNSGTAYMNVNNNRTSNKVIWSPEPPFTAGKQYYTSDIGPILTEILARPGWVSGNHVGLILWGHGMSVCNPLYYSPFVDLFPPYGQGRQLNWKGTADATPSNRPSLSLQYSLPGA